MPVSLFGRLVLTRARDGFFPGLFVFLGRRSQARKVSYVYEVPWGLRTAHRGPMWSCALLELQQRPDICHEVGRSGVGVHADTDQALLVDDPERSRVADVVTAAELVDERSRQINVGFRETLRG